MLSLLSMLGLLLYSPQFWCCMGITLYAAQLCTFQCSLLWTDTHLVISSLLAILQHSVFCVCVCVLALFQHSVFCHKLGQAALPALCLLVYTEYTALICQVHSLYTMIIRTTTASYCVIHELVNWKFTTNIGPLSRCTKVFVGAIVIHLNDNSVWCGSTISAGFHKYGVCPCSQPAAFS